MLTLDALQRPLEAFNQFGARCILDDGEAVVANPIGMGLNLDVRQHCLRSDLSGAVPRLRHRT